VARRKRDDFESLLEHLSAEDVKSFVQHYATHNEDFKKMFELYFSAANHAISGRQPGKNMMDTIFKRYSRKGFVDYNSAKLLSREVDQILEMGKSMLARASYLDAGALGAEVLKSLMHLYPDADDSDGYLNKQMEESLELVKFVMMEHDAAMATREGLFHFLLKELENAVYFEFTDIGYLMLNVTSDAAPLFGRTADLLSFIDKRLTDEPSDDYFKKSLLLQKLSLLEASGATTEVSNLINRNLLIPEIRIKAVQSALVSGKSSIAKQILSDGIEVAKKLEHDGTVNRWQRELINIAKQENDRETIRMIAKELAFSNRFDREFYLQWKSAFDEQEWPAILERQIENVITTSNTLSGKSRFRYLSPTDIEIALLAPVYVEEQYWQRLLLLLAKARSIDILFQYNDYLAPVYPTELLNLYLPFLRTMAANGRNRRAYVELIGIMRHIYKHLASGRSTILSLAEEFKKLYAQNPYRPAMLQELENFLRSPL
jgi:hypothetical protein